jgi:hypothetical protein
MYKNSARFTASLWCISDTVGHFPLLFQRTCNRAGEWLSCMCMIREPTGRRPTILILYHIEDGWRKFAFLHYNCARRMTQICVFNTRLFSMHNTLNYAIRTACLRMVLLTDVYRNLTSLWIKPRERAFKQFNPLNAKLNPICHLLALLWAHHILHISRIRVKSPVLNAIQ